MNHISQLLSYHTFLHALLLIDNICVTCLTLDGYIINGPIPLSWSILGVVARCLSAATPFYRILTNKNGKQINEKKKAKQKKVPTEKRKKKGNCEVMDVLTSLIAMIIAQYIIYQNVNLYPLVHIISICQLYSNKARKIIK